MLSKSREAAYTAILKEELLMATGCTEPIAIAYCAARMKELLGAIPEHIKIEVSGNIVKNVKSVIVPNTGGLKGIKAAAAAGIVAGNAKMELQVISAVPQELHHRIKAYSDSTPMLVVCMDTPRMLEIRITGRCGQDSAVVHIANSHSNIIFESKNGCVLKDIDPDDAAGEFPSDRSVLNVRDIVEYANTVDLSEVVPTLDNQIRCNSAIAEKGLRESWGAGIGRVLIKNAGNDIVTEARAYAAAGSDARMSGCEQPVVIVSGSGNQGITASVPVIRYAKHIGASQSELYRALLVSNLVIIHQKTGIGKLSAYCGAVSAGCGAGAGIAYLLGADYNCIASTITNAVAILSGTICDGAKPSCAAKIAMAVEAGILGYQMYMEHKQFSGGDGIVADGVEKTITNVGRLAKEGMRQTDRTILQIMTES